MDLGDLVFKKLSTTVLTDTFTPHNQGKVESTLTISPAEGLYLPPQKELF